MEACKQCLSALSSVVPVSDMSGGQVQPSADNSGQVEQNGGSTTQLGASNVSGVRSKSSIQVGALNVVPTPLAHSGASKTEHFKTIKEMATVSCVELQNFTF